MEAALALAGEAPSLEEEEGVMAVVVPSVEVATAMEEAPVMAVVGLSMEEEAQDMEEQEAQAVEAPSLEVVTLMEAALALADAVPTVEG
ncbi:neurofilament medium polypeptide-like [Limosa lapponica baueri]|uniref:Neurofilament medium polypeptide-like n=1 Tax=Limosa lapponica baueri TaxID=1758121 RepID=A0A2I0TP81_LIMLA|nr:neurofilament medium polypeptide-like [Limosa lapponica baueri]